MTRILAVDPGGTSGVAAFPPFVSHEMSTSAALSYADTAIEGWPDLQLVVCEAFIISARTLKGTRQYDALESIGALRYLTERAGIPFRLVTPAAAKSFSTDAKLRRLGWYSPSKGGHQNDAARVLLVAAVEEGLIYPEDLL